MKEVNKAAYTCKHSAHQVSKELCALNIDTEHICTLAVAAYGIEATSCLAPFKKDEQNCYYQQSNDNAYFYVCRNECAVFVCRTYSGKRYSYFLQRLEFFISTLNCVALTMVVIPFAKNIPARVTMNG